MKTAEKIIMFDSDEAAKPHTAKGWVTPEGLFYTEERMARYSGCTHVKCECGGITEKTWTKCEECRNKGDRERYLAMPFKEWDLKEPVFLRGHDKYFFSVDELTDYMDDQEIEEVDLIICTPNNFHHVDSSYWEDILPPDDEGEIPVALENALKELNKVIDTLPAASYEPGKNRTTYKMPQ